MPHEIRRTLAIVAVLSTLSLALPVPAQAANLRSWNPADLSGRVWSWLQELGLSLRPQEPESRLEKEGSAVNPDGRTAPESNSDEGSMVDPNGRK